MAIAIIMRLLHIFGAVALAGGVLAWKFAVQPAVDSAGEGERQKLSDAAAASWRPLAIFGAVAALGSGGFLISRAGNVPTAYHIVVGIKILLAFHVMASVFMAVKPGNPKRARQLAGAAWAAIVVVILAVLLRWVPALVS